MRVKNEILKKKKVLLVHFSHVFFLFNAYVHGLHFPNSCNSTRCSTNGLLVQFPFRIKGQQPDHCSYPQPGFDLSSSKNNHTILHLTPTWNLTIKSINYSSQQFSAYDSQGCSKAKILNFNSSDSPFTFDEFNNQIDYSSFNCCSSSLKQQDNSD